MSFDAFMKITGVKGESTDSEYPDWIEVMGFSHSISQPKGGSSSAGAQSGARADHDDFTITKKVDYASPELAMLATTGKYVDEVIIEVGRAMGQRITFLKWTFKKSIISSYMQTGSTADDSLPVETVGFRYSEIHWAYRITTAEGGKGAWLEKKWSTAKNAPA